jgi:ABC-type uncharacterized transport system involved in gliding motility auxiliary subunit
MTALELNKPSRRFGLGSAGIAAVLAIIVFLAVNVLSAVSLRNARLDLTQDHVHTLSPGTINTLAKLDEPIKLRLYYSAKVAATVPRFASFGTQVKDLLAEYQSRAGSKLVIEIIEPEPFSAQEDEAAQVGLRGVPTDRGETLYFGLVGTNLADGREIIPYFSLERENFLEYDVTRLISNLSHTKKPLVGLMSDLPLSFGPGGMMAAMRGQSKPYVFYEELAKQYEIRQVPTASEVIDPEIKVLVLVHPAKLSPASLYALDQYVLRGGRLIALVDPLSEIALNTSRQSQGGPPVGESSNLKTLFVKWGFEMVDGQFVADRKNAQQVVFVDNGQQRQMGFLAWMRLGEESFDKSDVAIAQFKTINMASVGALKPIDKAKTNFQPLIKSSNDAMLIPIEKIASTPDPVGLMRDFKPDGQSYVLAARITGIVETAFPDGKPKDAQPNPANPTPEKAADQIKTSQSPINVVVIADTDFLDDKFWVQTAELFGQRVPVPNADNGNFILSLVDNMGGSGDLIGLRARPAVQRPFTLVEDMRRRAEEKFLAEEKRLRDELAETERRMSGLNVQGKSPQGVIVLTPAQVEELNKFQKQRADTRIALREVQRKLRVDIDRLEFVVKLVNIALVPMLLALFAISLSVYQRRRRASRLAALKAADRSA